ncbi:nudix hydrolase 9 isoform X2 [Salvia splendens]|uniref:nudix hydrolase 9 isoform X2 n=1 Tax=Salvia splendens TaxID=180675 RepID=UPI001C25BF70|nr:nudix hydrolase 9 isoform X2 [Salvia splendens]
METVERRTEFVASDELPKFKLLLSCPAGLSPSEVSAVFDQKYDRIPHPDISLENTIAEMWERRVEQNPSLFNGLKFRYGGHGLDFGPDSSQKMNVRLHLGLTDYRTFVGTNLNPLWERFLVPSEDDWRRGQHTSNPLGNGAIVETSNKEVVVLQRSANVGEFPGHFVFPGGHPEPKELGIIRHQTDGSIQEMVEKRVSEEMFESIIREVVEEIGVPAATLGKPIFIGISQRALNVRPTAFFFIKCSLKSEEIHKCYSSAEDSYESTQLYTMPMIRCKPTIIDLRYFLSRKVWYVT